MSIGRAADRLVEWEGKLVAFDRSRAKVWLETKKPSPPDGSNVWLRFGPRHKESPVVGGMVWGTESDGSITILLSLTTREFQSLTNLVSALLGGETAAPSPEREVRVPPVPLRSEPSEPRPEPEVPVTLVPPRTESEDVNLAQQAEACVARGDYEEAWRLYYQALQAAPEDVSLWYGLGVALSRLGLGKEAEEAFRYVVRRGRPDSEEVRLARQWLVDAGVLIESPALPVPPLQAEPSKPEVLVAPGAPRAESGGVNLARQAQARAAQGDYEGAWRLYSQALRAEPADVSLWYALGATASHLNQRAETEEAFPPAARPSQPEAKEVRLSNRALVSAGALAELMALTHVAEPMGEVRKDKRAVKGKATRRASEPAAAVVPPPRSKLSGPSPVRQAEARVVQRDRMLEGSLTQDERERALLALIEEGYRVPPSRAELIAKVVELRHKGDRERGKTSKKTRR